MGVYSALLTGVSGLNGQSIKMGSISDNIANVNTVGYKKIEVPFQTLVTERVGSTRFQPGGILSRPRQTLDVQGVIQSTSHSLDMAVSGRGFFIVTDDPSGGLDNARFFTRAGSFRPVIDPNDEAGALLRNSGGFYLMGFRLNEDSEVVTGENDRVSPDPTTSDLEAIDLNNIRQAARATTEIFTKMGLPSELVPTADAVSLFDPAGRRIIFNAGNPNAPGAMPRDPAAAAAANALNIEAVELAEIPADAAIATITGPDGQKIAIRNSTDPNNASQFNIDLSAIDGMAGGSSTLENFLNLLDADTDVAPAGFDMAYGDAIDAIRAAVDPMPGNNPPQKTMGLEMALRDARPLNPVIERIYTGALADVAAGGGNGPINRRLTTRLNDLEAPQARDDARANAIDAARDAKTFTLGNGDTIQLDAGVTPAGQVEIRGVLNFNDERETQELQIGEFNAAGDPLGGNPVQFADPTDVTTLGKFAFDDAVAANQDRSANQGWATNFERDFVTAFQVFDALGATHNTNVQWKRRLDEANLWEIRVTDSDIAAYNAATHPFDAQNPDEDGVRFVVDDGDGQASFTQRLFLKFDGAGALAEVRTTADGASGETLEGETTTGTVANRETDPAQPPRLIALAAGPVIETPGTTELVEPDPDFGGNVEAAFVSEADGDEDPGGAEALVFEWNIGRPTGLDGSDAGTGLDGIKQFDSGESRPAIEIDLFSQNGARFGNPTGFSIDDNGVLSALFDNGVTAEIYRVPLATFANPNGMVNLTGNAYQQSTASGEPQLKEANDQGAGRIVGAALEQSNVDLGNQFTDMIITQQGFTANTRTITTADRMLEELVRILR